MRDPNDLTKQISITLKQSQIDFLDDLAGKTKAVDDTCPGKRSGVVRQIVAWYIEFYKKNAKISQ